VRKERFIKILTNKKPGDIVLSHRVGRKESASTSMPEMRGGIGRDTTISHARMLLARSYGW
jgi:hypothetical protein